MVSPGMESEVKQVLNDYWESYFRGDYDRWASYLPDHYKNIGTTAEEIWSSKKEIVDYTLRLSDQLIGQAEMRNKTVEVISYVPYVMAHEIGDVYVQAEEGWVYYAELRLSSLMVKNEDGWKILHQHGSFPDSKADEGEAFGLNELRIENKKLKDAIQSRTKELEEKNQALEIEAALERVRAKAISMQKSEDLSHVAVELFNEFSSFNGRVGTCGFALCDKFPEEDEYWVCWETGVQPPMRMPHTTDPICKFLHEGWEKKIDYYEVEKSGEELAAHFDYLLTVPSTKSVFENWKNLQNGFPNYQKYHAGNFKQGFVFVITLDPTEKVNSSLLKSFAKVFQQAYTRFLDLERAEAQAREAQIEAAVERVRAKTIAMHHSSELGATSLILFDELKALGQLSEQISIGIFNEDNKVLDLYATVKGEQWEQAATIDLDEKHVMQKIYSSWKQNKKVLQVELIGKELKEYNLFRQKFSDLKFSEDRWVIHCAFFSKGVITFSTSKSYSEQTMQLLKRFAQVFDGTYTRFLDLQKAEAQTREARIETSLERVRAQSMAMHKTEELQNVIYAVHSELLKLKIPIVGGSFVIINDEVDDELYAWGAGGTADTVQRTHIPHFNRPFAMNLRDGIHNGPGFFTEHFSRAEKKSYFTELFRFAPWSEIPEEEKGKTLDNPGDYTRSVAVGPLTSLVIINQNGRNFTEEENNILRRFQKTFEQSYTRFLDLQKAEKQTMRIEAINSENERLLHSILPAKIAEQIRSGQQRVVKRFDEVSILFADIVGFTVLSEKLSPDRVVDILNGLFSSFDDLTDQYGLEKIKTIGDAYMVAAGVPDVKENHAHTMFQFAQEMLRALQDFNQQNNIELNLRIGISSGPVVAGVIGKKKFAYDLWGDTVNTAARMEAYGKEGRIQVSPPCYEILRHSYHFEKIANVPIKGKGVMDVFLWKGVN